MIGSINTGFAFRSSSFETFLGTKFESYRLRIHCVHRAIVNPYFHAIDTVTGQNTIIHHGFETILDRLLVVFIDRTTNNTPLKLELLLPDLKSSLSRNSSSAGPSSNSISAKRPEPPDCFFKRSRWNCVGQCFFIVYLRLHPGYILL
jgi:hypothetical protein